MISPNHSRHPRRLRSLFKIGTLIALSLVTLILFIDWRTGAQFTRSWLQVSFTVLGLCLIGCALFVSALSRPRRIILSGAGLLILLAVIDSLNGQQDILTIPVVLLLFWAGAFTDTTIELLRQGMLTLRQKGATSIAFLAALTYVASASYYLFINLTVAPQNFDHHWLFGFALVLNTVVRMLGGLTPVVPPMTGNIRICPSCGLRNIPERHTCSHCGTLLGPIEHVA